MPLPKYKHSKSNTRTRRAAWLTSLKAPAMHRCPKCDTPKLTHRACPVCGLYNRKVAPAMRRPRE